MTEHVLTSVRASVPESIKIAALVKGFLGATLVAVVAYLGWTVYHLKAAQQNYQATYEFLANGLPAAPDGKVYNRSQVLDALVKQALANIAQQQPARPAAPGPAQPAPPVRK